MQDLILLWAIYGGFTPLLEISNKLPIDERMQKRLCHEVRIEQTVWLDRFSGEDTLGLDVTPDCAACYSCSYSRS